MCYSYEEIERQNRRRLQAERRRRSMSRIALTPSNLIYPMRAPSNIAYSSPPPAYRERASPAYREHASPVDGYVLRGDRRPSVVREDGHLWQDLMIGPLDKTGLVLEHSPKSFR